MSNLSIIIDITHIYDLIKNEMLIQRYKRIVNLLNMQLRAANNFNLFNMNSLTSTFNYYKYILIITH